MKLNQSEVVEYTKKNLKEFGGEMSQSQIAKETGRTPARICQIAKVIRYTGGVPQSVNTEAAASTAEA